ncbi:MAG TPA: class I SAM-dependent methyltransferase [Armatimonadota bacterium]|jgi:SAM-dependent methyltransferase
MSKLGQTIKAGIATGLCALGPCGLERKYKFSRRLAQMVRSIETSQFPGTGLYAFTTSKFLRPLYASIAEEILSAGHYNRILALGTGLGYLPTEITLRDPSIQVFGIDELPDAVKVAEANANVNKAGKSIHFSEGESANLPYPGRYFDLVVSANMLNHWANPKEVFAAVNHVLVPGGAFWLCDYRENIPAETWESLRAKLPIRCRVPFAVGLMASAMEAYSEADLLEMAGDARFEVEVMEQRTYTLLGQPMPLFNMLKLSKPIAFGEHDGSEQIIEPSSTEDVS